MRGIKKYLLFAGLVCSVGFYTHTAVAQTWSNVGSNIYGDFKALAVYNGNLYAGGVDSLDGKKTNVAKWDGTKWTATDTGQLGHVIAMIAYKGKLYAGTEYGEGGMKFGKLFCWNDTVWQKCGAPNGKITCFTIFDSTLYVGGFFTGIDTVRARHIAKWSDSLKCWRMVNRGGVDGKVLAMASYHKRLFVGGQFDFVTAWNGKTWEDVRGTAGNIMNGWVLAFTTWNDELYAGGQFDFVTKWDGTQWLSLGPFNDGVRSLTIYNNELYAGGDFTGIPQFDHAYHIGKFGGISWDCVGGVIYWSGECKPYTGTVWSLCVYNDDLYIGGQFMIAGGKIIPNIARWNKPVGK